MQKILFHGTRDYQWLVNPVYADAPCLHAACRNDHHDAQRAVHDAVPDELRLPDSKIAVDDL
jgi:hypothetical protein